MGSSLDHRKGQKSRDFKDDQFSETSASNIKSLKIVLKPKNNFAFVNIKGSKGNR